MKIAFICTECGTITSCGEEMVITINMKCSNCNHKLDWNNSFPPLNAVDFVLTAETLFESCKQTDKSNLDWQYQHLLNETKTDIDKTTIDRYLNEYEKLLEKYDDNNDKNWVEIDERFEEILSQVEDVDKELAIFAAIKVCNKNRFRKPYVIMVASLIEQLFHDYLVTVVGQILSEHGRSIFLKKYETAGIQSILDIVDAFLDESIKDKMERYSKGFWDKWANLRKLRNEIIHSNSKYISKRKTSEINKMIEESCELFLKLKSELYKNNANMNKVV